MAHLMNYGNFDKERIIKSHVYMAVEAFASGFKKRHIEQVDDPEGTINMKIHNVFIAALGDEIQYYTALVRSLDSSLGNMLEKLGIRIADLFYDVKKRVEGPLYAEQTQIIAQLLEEYKRRIRSPSVDDYQILRTISDDASKNKRHESDYYLIDTDTGCRHLVELKIGGDLDNKKARSEKEALLEQYAILSNTLPQNIQIELHFATAYNRYGEGREWRQERVRQYFADEELLIGKDFWNFVCKSDEGYNIVIEAYKEKADEIRSACTEIKNAYLG